LDARYTFAATTSCCSQCDTFQTQPRAKACRLHGCGIPSKLCVPYLRGCAELTALQSSL
jgi:hypothetical protein